MNDAVPTVRDLARALATSWRARVALVLVVLMAVCGWFAHLTDHLGYASALLCAVTVVPACAVASSAIAAVTRKRGLDVSAGTALAVAGSLAVGAVATHAVLALVRGAFGNECAPATGAVFFLLVPLPGALLASFLGALIGRVVQRAWLAGLLAGLLLPATIAWSLVRFYQSPAVFAYDPFFGFYPGAIYDEVIALSPTLVTYRLGTLAWIVATAGLLAWRWPRVAVRWAPAAWCAFAAALMGLGVYAAGPVLGHRADAREIEHALGMRLDGRRCSVVYARAIDAHQARLTRDDCEVRIAQVETFFAVHGPSHVTVFLFENAEQKQRWMGAADTYIAKPWRAEVYLQYAPFPHPVLKHELAHVVAGAMAPGLFRVSTRWGVPLVGLIEGAAESVGWDGDGANDATPHQWSHAMLDAGLAPRAATIVGLGFYAYGGATAYTVAASFARFLVDRYGPARFAVLYAHGDFVQAYGRGPDALETEWHAFLRTVPVPSRLTAIARARFRRASLLARTCPHETAEMLDRAQEQLAAGDVAPARAVLERVVRNDPTDVHAQTSLVEAWARLGDVAHALSFADEARETAGPAASARLRARVGDAMWRWRGPDAARDVYAPVDPDLFNEDEARTVEVKRWALGLPASLSESVDDSTVDPSVAIAVRDLLIGRGDVSPDTTASVGMLALAFADGTPAPGNAAVARYLLGRALVTRERSAEAARVLAGVDEERLPTLRLRAETVRLRATALFLAGDRVGARPLFESLRDDEARPAGARGIAADWLDRLGR